MVKQKTEQGNATVKWLTITVIAVLVIAVIVIPIVFSQKIGNLNSDLDDAEGQVAALQVKVNELQSDISTLQSQLTQEKANSASLDTQLKTKNSEVDSLKEEVASQKLINTQQDAVITTMKYPRHFNSLVELTNWLQQDETDSLYAGYKNPEIAFILQIRAARAGYLLPVRLPTGGSLDYITNLAIIGDVVYSVRGGDDFVERWSTISPALPSYPITPESGQ